MNKITESTIDLPLFIWYTPTWCKKIHKAIIPTDISPASSLYWNCFLVRVISPPEYKPNPLPVTRLQALLKPFPKLYKPLGGGGVKRGSLQYFVSE